MGYKATPRVERFWNYVTPEPNSGCWLWCGPFMPKNGYGVLYFGPRTGGKRSSAHRYSWELHRGPIPEGMCVLHNCDTAPCVNPDHLRIGTHADNTADKFKRGRDRRSDGSRRWAKLTPEIVLAIRRMGSEGKTLQAIGEVFKISASHVGLINRRKVWRHLA